MSVFYYFILCMKWHATGHLVAIKHDKNYTSALSALFLVKLLIDFKYEWVCSGGNKQILTFTYYVFNVRSSPLDVKTRGKDPNTILLWTRMMISHYLKYELSVNSSKRWANLLNSVSWRCRAGPFKDRNCPWKGFFSKYDDEFSIIRKFRNFVLALVP